MLHFAAVAYVGESVAEPMRYYKNITANTLSILEAAEQNSVPRFVYSSTCAVYVTPETGSGEAAQRRLDLCCHVTFNVGTTHAPLPIPPTPGMAALQKCPSRKRRRCSP